MNRRGERADAQTLICPTDFRFVIKDLHELLPGDFNQLICFAAAPAGGRLSIISTRRRRAPDHAWSQRLHLFRYCCRLTMPDFTINRATGVIGLIDVIALINSKLIFDHVSGGYLIQMINAAPT